MFAKVVIFLAALAAVNAVGLGVGAPFLGGGHLGAFSARTAINHVAPAGPVGYAGALGYGYGLAGAYGHGLAGAPLAYGHGLAAGPLGYGHGLLGGRYGLGLGHGVAKGLW